MPLMRSRKEPTRSHTPPRVARWCMQWATAARASMALASVRRHNGVLGVTHTRGQCEQRRPYLVQLSREQASTGTDQPMQDAAAPACQAQVHRPQHGAAYIAQQVRCNRPLQPGAKRHRSPPPRRARRHAHAHTHTRMHAHTTQAHGQTSTATHVSPATNHWKRPHRHQDGQPGPPMQPEPCHCSRVETGPRAGQQSELQRPTRTMANWAQQPWGRQRSARPSCQKGGCGVAATVAEGIRAVYRGSCHPRPR